ncbi:PTS lactose/cellobiose transporter subunit IIA [Spiroplasma endosymbiont of Panorpa germanica]|uniref:PTS lactose/cellobiose transporter subunit IIA n=1 Tax=Spiroplasma endosymbiont of Panorpa germanica TaxID=3066314 RepID=UPI0030CCD968
MGKTWNFEEISFTIIAFAGEAKGHAMGAIVAAKNGRYEEAENLIEEAEKSILTAEKTHMDIVSAEAGGEKITFPILFIHAEDQLLTTQTIILLAKEFIDVYKKIGK